MDPAAALCRVNVVSRDYGRILGTKVTSADLSHDSLVIYKFLCQEYSKLKRIQTSNQTFQNALKALEQNYDRSNVKDFISLLLTILSLPQQYNPFNFLITPDIAEL